MTAAQAIARIDTLKPNKYTNEEKRAWLNALDHEIFNDIVSTHEHPLIDAYEPFTSLNTELLAYAPYDEELYPAYLGMMIDRANGEIDRYNQSAVTYNNALLTFRNHYNRTHRPLRSGRFRW